MSYLPSAALPILYWGGIGACLIIMAFIARAGKMDNVFLVLMGAAGMSIVAGFVLAVTTT